MDFFKTILTQYSNGNVSIYLVNGEYIRDNLHIDFVEGDNDAHNPALLEPGEVWIDCDQSGSEFRANMVHELTERRLMLTQRMTYGQAHDEANNAEQFARRHREQLEDLVQAELKLAPPLNKPEVVQETVRWQR